MPDPRTRVRQLVSGSFSPHRVRIGPLALVFLFCSNGTWRLCQAEISIRQALATHADVSGWSSRDIRERRSQEQSGLRRISVGAGLKPAPAGGTRQHETVLVRSGLFPLQTPAHALPRSLSLRCRPERRSKNRALVVSQQRRLVDRPMVMDLPPRATRLDEPSGCANSKLEANSGSFAEAFFASNEEMVVIVTLRCEIVECYAHGRWPAKQLRIPFLQLEVTSCRLRSTWRPM